MTRVLSAVADSPRWSVQLVQAAREQPLGAIGALVLITMAVLAIGAPWIAPYDPTEGNPALLNAPPSAAHCAALPWRAP